MAVSPTTDAKAYSAFWAEAEHIALTATERMVTQKPLDVEMTPRLRRRSTTGTTRMAADIKSVVVAIRISKERREPITTRTAHVARRTDVDAAGKANSMTLELYRAA